MFGVEIEGFGLGVCFVGGLWRWRFLDVDLCWFGGF